MKKKRKSNPKMMHSTYFTLAMGSTPANQDSYIECCAAYLSDSPGMESFWVAALAQDIYRPINDRTFQISMNQVFEDKAAFDHYNGNDPRHEQFVVEVNRWAGGTGRRVFDSNLSDLIVNDKCVIPGPADPPRLLHNVYFSLTDKSAKSIKKFTRICLKLLSQHDGICTFAIGKMLNLHRDVSVSNYDVAMNILYQNKSAYTNYLASEEHAAFPKATAGMITNIQVFDSYMQEMAT